MMKTTRHTLRYALGAAIVAAGVLAIPSTHAWAALCVWRNPDADIREFFGAGSYKTLLVKVGSQKGPIEQAIGTQLDPDETELKFWPVIQDGKRVGYVASHLGKGDYGAIEVIMAIVDPADGPAKIRAVKIQRDRERYRAELRSPTFLNQFKGKTAQSTLKVGQDIQPAHANAQRGSQVVALSVKKMLVAYEKLGIASR